MKTQTTITLAALATFTALSVANPAPDPRIITKDIKIDLPAVDVKEAEMKKNAEGGAITLDEAMIEATRKQAAKLGYEFAN